MAEKKYSPLVRRLLPAAKAVLIDHPEGATVDELIIRSVYWGLLTGKESHRRLSALGHVFKAAGAVNTGEMRASRRVGQKGALHLVWRLPAPETLQRLAEHTVSGQTPQRSAEHTVSGNSTLHSRTHHVL